MIRPELAKVMERGLAQDALAALIGGVVVAIPLMDRRQIEHGRSAHVTHL